MTTTTSAVPFVPFELDCSDFAHLQPYYHDLRQRALDSVEELRRWLDDLSRLSELVYEYGSRCYIDHTCHTDDEALEKRYLGFVENVEPKIKPVVFELQKKFLACPHHTALGDRKFDLLARSWGNEVELFRPENIPLDTELTRLGTSYGKVMGAMTITRDGKELTLQQAGRLLEETDRSVREDVWRAIEGRRLRDREPVEDLFEKMTALRERIAANAGCADYRAYAWKARERFDYTPEHCADFERSVRELVLPVVERLDRERRTAMRVDRLRPWDLSVDPLGRPPLRPFAQDDIDGFVDRTRRIFDRLSPPLGRDFRSMEQGRHLDLASRKGKRPGGYQATLEASRQPFIFMNAVGTQRDVETLLHEAGHAFHYMLARSEPVVFLRHAPIEFCEVASMSMELLAGPCLDEFYDRAEADRARRTHLEGVIRLLPWVATVDAYQHWLYSHPGHSRDERTAAWLEVSGSLASREVDWSGFDEVKASRWHRQLHIFQMPFYYIEYGIAQLGSLQLWLAYQRDPATAIDRYRSALALGGTRPLPGLFEAAGLRFDFGRRTIAPLMDAVMKELDRLPV